SDAHGISILDRDPLTGILVQKTGTAGCITDTGNDDTGAPTCAIGRVLGGADALAVSPRGATVYVAAAADHGVSAFQVGDDGALTQLAGTGGCITLSGTDGLGAISCATGRALTFPFGVAISPDGRSLYVVADDNRSPDGVAVFSLDPATGAAAQLPGAAGCITADGTSDGVADACANGGPGLVGIYDPTISPDGASVYLPGYDGQTLGVYSRETGASSPATDATPVGSPPPVSSSPARTGHLHSTPPPLLTRLSQSAATWPEVRSRPRRVATAFSFTLNEGARVTLTFTQQVTGGRVGRACVTSGSGRPRAPRCVRTLTLGALSVQGRAGYNRVAFNGHLPRLGWLPRGRRITVTAVAVAGSQRSAARRLSFVISSR
ncbi:MAG TPA: hypothetical protein VGH67_06695, partial [Solirubrobacteraceae bacterium]